MVQEVKGEVSSQEASNAYSHIQHHPSSQKGAPMSQNNDTPHAEYALLHNEAARGYSSLNHGPKGGRVGRKDDPAAHVYAIPESMKPPPVTAYSPLHLLEKHEDAAIKPVECGQFYAQVDRKGDVTHPHTSETLTPLPAHAYAVPSLEIHSPSEVEMSTEKQPTRVYAVLESGSSLYGQSPELFTQERATRIVIGQKQCTL
jgi:hypothetical protein